MAKHSVKAKCSKCEFSIRKTADTVENLFSAMMDLGIENPRCVCPECKGLLNVQSSIKKPFKWPFEEQKQKRG